MQAAYLLMMFLLQDPSREETLKQDIESSIQKLDTDKILESQTAKEELVEVGRPAVPYLVAALNKTEPVPPPRLRRLLCEILGQIRCPDNAAVNALKARLTDREEYGVTVAAAAAWALGRIGDTEAIAPLIAALQARETEVDKDLKVASIEALGYFRAKEATSAIIPALKDHKKSGDGEWGRVVASVAAEALGRIRAKEAVEALADQLNTFEYDPMTNLTVGDAAARALERITGESKGDLYGSDKEKALKGWRDWHGSALTNRRVAKIVAAVAKFKQEKSKLPDTLEDLKSYEITDDDRKDGWSRDFKYSTKGTGAEFDLYSLGADGEAGGKDADADLWNHEAWKTVKVEETNKALAEVAGQLENFKKNHEQYPAQLGDLKDKPAVIQGTWPEGGYLKEVPKDGFGNAFVYANPGTAGAPYDLYSLGLDGREGGEGLDAEIRHGAAAPPENSAPGSEVVPPAPSEEKKSE